MKKLLTLATFIILATNLFPAGGTGKMTVSPETAIVSSQNNSFTFTFTAGDFSFSNGYVHIVKPDNFQNFESRNISIIETKNAKNVQIININSSNIYFFVEYLQANNGYFKFEYKNVTAPVQTGKYYFTVYTRSTKFESYKRISTLPYIRVLPLPTATPTPTSVYFLNINAIPTTCNNFQQMTYSFYVGITGSTEGGDVFIHIDKAFIPHSFNPTPMATVVNPDHYVYNIGLPPLNNQTFTITSIGHYLTTTANYKYVTLRATGIKLNQISKIFKQEFCQPTKMPTTIPVPTSTPKHTLNWVGIDAVNKNLVINTNSHSEKNLFSCKNFLFTSYTPFLSSASPKFISLIIPNGISATAKIRVATSDMAEVSLYKNANFNSFGTPLTLTAVNLYSTCPVNTTITAFENGNTTNAGTLLFKKLLPCQGYFTITGNSDSLAMPLVSAIYFLKINAINDQTKLGVEFEVMEQ